jgi:eukaryotic-like serine/threonine-protein kinase
VKPLLRVNRYLVFEEVASGGMATVHFGRLVADSGFSRTVAIKRLHPHITKDPSFVSTLLDEARLASRIRHPNVVPTLDLVNEGGEVFVVMEYVDGESLARLFRVALRNGKSPPLPVCLAIVGDLLLGLHAAHEASDDHGAPLNIVHRDVSPQNVLVGLDGVARVVDFGVAKAASRLQTTAEGQIKGKLAYMSPEQLELKPCDRRADIFATGVLSWELFTGRRLFSAESPAQTMARVLSGEIVRPSTIAPSVSPELEVVILRALERDPEKRYRTALEMAEALNRAVPRAAALDVQLWVQSVVGEKLRERAKRLAQVEASTATDSSLRPTSTSTATDLSLRRTTEATEHTATDLSATTTSGKVPRGRRMAMGLALVAALAIAVALLGRMWFQTRSRDDVAAAANPGSTSASSLPETPSTTVTKPAPSAASAAANGSAPANDSERTLPTSPPGKSTPTRAPLRSVASPPSKPAKAAANCNPNYYIDGNGQKRFKDECFQ